MCFMTNVLGSCKTVSARRPWISSPQSKRYIDHLFDPIQWGSMINLYLLLLSCIWGDAKMQLKNRWCFLTFRWWAPLEQWWWRPWSFTGTWIRKHGKTTQRLGTVFLAQVLKSSFIRWRVTHKGVQSTFPVRWWHMNLRLSASTLQSRSVHTAGERERESKLR